MAEMKLPVFSDLHRLPEDERIRIIGDAYMAGAKVGVPIDDEPDKPQRYRRKLQERYPGIRVAILPGLVPGTKTLSVG
jgi:hypothetical protein